MNKAMAVQDDTVADGMSAGGAMRELELMRRELEEELRASPGPEKFKRLALRIEAIDISLDRLLHGGRR